jgi:hypothetical protein
MECLFPCTAAIRAFLAGQTLGDHWFVWGGDGRITAGHLAVLAERAAAGPLELIMFDGVTGAGWSWSQRDEAMARRLLDASVPGARTLAVAGNAHTPTSLAELGVPMGARLGGQRPGVREIRISYGSGGFYNGGPRQFARRADQLGKIQLYQHDSELVLDWRASPRPLSSQTLTSRCRSANAGRQGRAREWPPGAGHAAIGTRIARRPRSRLWVRKHVRP